MTALLAITLFLQEPGSPRLLDATLAAPVEAVPVVTQAPTAESIRWRVLGTTGGVLAGSIGLALFFNDNAASRQERTAITIGGAVLGAAVGAPLGYLAGRSADEGASPARIGIGCTCLIDGAMAALVIISLFNLVGNV